MSYQPRTKNLLITGGAGFIGSEFVRQAVDKGEVQSHLYVALDQKYINGEMFGKLYGKTKREEDYSKNGRKKRRALENHG